MSNTRITIEAQLQMRHDTETNWMAADPVLRVGEPAYTVGYDDRFKIGDGQRKWSELPYLTLYREDPEGVAPNALGDLSDVSLSQPLEGQILVYDKAKGRWVNRTPTGGGGGGLDADQLKAYLEANGYATDKDVLAAAQQAYELAYTDSVNASKNYTDDLQKDLKDNPESYLSLKTINGQSIYGVGDIIISGGAVTETKYNVYFTPYNGPTLYVSRGDKAEIKFAFVSQVIRPGMSDFVDTGEACEAVIAVKKPTDSSYVAVRALTVPSNVVTTIDLSGYLGDGNNLVRISGVGETTGKTAENLAYTIVRSSLSLDAHTFAWWLPSEGPITVPFYIGGTLDKTLHVTVTGPGGYRKSYTSPIGTSPYMEFAYPQAIEHPGAGGVYTITAYVASADGNFRTSDLAIQTIFITAGDTRTYMAVNNVAAMATNYSDNAFLDYAVYNGDKSTASVTFSIEKDGQSIYGTTLDSVTTGAKNTFSAPLEVSTLDSNDFYVSILAVSGGTSIVAARDITVDNSYSFAAAPGAVFFMNPKTRDNSQSDRKYIVNEADGSKLLATWSGMNWGSDGYQTVGGVKVLRIFAGSSVSIPYRPFEKESARTGKSIELDLLIDNVVDYEDTVLGIVKTLTASWLGVKIYPDKAVVFSQLQHVEEDQSFKFEDRTRLRLTLVVMPDAYGNAGFNLVIMYVNGVKNREFAYANTDYFANDGSIAIGSESADIDIYALRVYDAALSAAAVKQNFVNLLDTTDEKKAAIEKDDVFAANGVDIDIEKVKKLCNVIVFEGEMPSLANPNKFTNNWHFFWRDNPEWNCVVRGITQDGQGTSAKLYREWNQRGKTNDDTVTTYADGSTSTGAFTFIPGRPKVKRFTFKLNWASSCQCNKMGSVNSINDLCRALALLDPDSNPVGVYQLPFAGFQGVKDDSGNMVYIFTGLYTGGPDKGDENWMNWDTDRYPDLVSVEGADNAAPGALFRVPWNASSGRWQYNVGEESLQYNGENCFDYNAGAADAGDKAAVQELLEKVWMPVYNFVYECSPHLAYWSGTLASLNADIENAIKTDTEYWLDGGDVYYYEAAEGKFIAADTGSGPINLFDQLVDKGYGLTSAQTSGATGAQLNSLFVAARVAKFRKEAGDWFNMGQARFGVNWMEMAGSTDTRAKNTYWTMRGRQADGYRCQFYWDDTDTIGPFTNQGQDRKPYWCEVGDQYDNGQPVWNGEQSRFFNLVERAFPSELADDMRTMLGAMVTLGGLSTGNKSAQLFAFFHRYYFSQAQEYFPGALYNATAKRLYESAKIVYGKSYTNDTDPITQSLGDYYSGWKRWIKRRIQYIQSKYSFGDYSANGGDIITVRAAGQSINYTITPAIWMYPNIASGTSIVRGARTESGQPCNITIQLGGASDQQNTIKGAHYLQDIGPWHDKNVHGTMSVYGRMLRELHIGHPTANIVITVSSLVLGETPSLRLIDLRRVSTLAGALDLTGCSHLQQLFATGTSLTSILLANGGPLRSIGSPATMQQIFLRNFPLLTNSGVDVSQCKAGITDYMVVGCDAMKPLALLAEIIKAQEPQGSAHALKRIRATGIDETYSSSDVLSTLVNLTDGTYAGLDADGVGGSVTNPVLEGKVSINANAYQDDVEALQSFFGQDFIINITGNYFLRIIDPEVLRALLANGVGSDGGVTMQQAEAVTGIANAFYKNTEIEYFNEFENFTGVIYLVNSNASASIKHCFYGCTNLKEIRLPSSLTTINDGTESGQSGAFFGCTSLTNIGDMSHLVRIGRYAFRGCTSLAQDIDLPNAEGTIGLMAFYQTAIKKVVNLGKITILDGQNTASVNSSAGPFARCESLVEAHLPATLTEIRKGAFGFCTALTTLIIDATTPPTLAANAWYGSNALANIYVPDASVDAYKAASGWSDASVVNLIKPMSQYNG